MNSSVEWITRLASFDTTSRISNLELIDCVADELRRVGVEPLILGNEDAAQVRKANLFATFPACDGRTDGGIVLSGHTDVVPVDGQDWDSDPFTAQQRGGRLYGRGTADMKGYLGVILSRLERISQATLTEPLHLAFSYDEEVGLLGAERMIGQFAGHGIRPASCIVGEPSGMRVVRGHKSINLFVARFRGVAAHSSLTPQGVNAIHYAGRFIEFYRQLTHHWRENGPFDDAYPVPFTTGGVNLISGGIAGNTVPDACEVEFEFRALGTVDTAPVVAQIREFLFDVLEPEMKAEQAAAGVELIVKAQGPGLEVDDDAGIVRLAQDCGGLPSDEKVTYGTEAGLFHRAGIETVVCGPGEIAVAHAANEYVDLEQIEACESFVDSLIERLERGTA
ncbi:acetylornithine deacetylase [Paeniglutamicibacter antarcticus]|uniref:Acetylornithine deacetylase n=1 Tax=Arthrobacter terrae TaxID=2935737 RepID=A0A931CJ57_9MICC|nr:acetylornithine deacetylase [Arthrobacter terrae]